MVIQEKSAYLKEENMINIPDFKKFEITLDEKNEANVHYIQLRRNHDHFSIL